MSNIDDEIQSGLEQLVEQYEDTYHRPKNCEKCGAWLKPRGRGRYYCERCDLYELDDYGKVREFLYTHPGASAAEVTAYTGVERRAINQMLKEEKIETHTGFNPFKEGK